ncbi:MAG TPA: 2-oxo-4-hydroxy-4-carboxy-5-ureidoimidazoline decarboxylase [Ureibacillus sp.]|nr:2-oxo-4-hydroxy-4-carboxy-5-ureidoimidazoline decarboxylase [Ureibacillus sp.]
MEATSLPETLNSFSHDQFIQTFGGIFEHSPWIAEKALSKKPFKTVNDAFEVMKEIVEEASYNQQLALIKEHPELGKRIKMSKASVREQSGAGLDNLSPEEFEVFSTLNQSYMEKFNFPFIIAVAGKDKSDILVAMKERLNNTREVEFETALDEIYKIAKIRFNAIIESLTN